MIYTGGDIKRLGKKIVENDGNIDNNDLELLQEYRTSFTQPLSETFNALTIIKNKVDRQGIIAFRLKRIKTIINKVLRKPDQELNRMGDIAGIRIITQTEEQIYRILTLIKNEFELSGKIRDYIIEPKSIGYKGVHVYVRSKNSNKMIEVQLRTNTFHNWSTLVEITDLIYNTRLKELGFENNIELAEFHNLISSDIILNEQQANHIYKVLEKYDYITRLSKIFRNNNAEVKKQWININPRSRYFLIESSSENVPILKGYTVYEQAEEDYFNKYKEDKESLIVLTAIYKPSFELISIAYANYILSYHNFMNDIEFIIKELAIEALETKRNKKFKKIFKTFEELQVNTILHIFIGADDYFIDRVTSNRLFIKSARKISTKKQKEIRRKVDSEFSDRVISHRKFLQDIYKTIGKPSLFNFFLRKFLKESSTRMERRLRELTVEFE